MISGIHDRRAGAGLQCAGLANNLVRWSATRGDPGPVDRLTVARTGLIGLPGRLVSRGGTLALRGPLNWPWAEWFDRRLDRLRTLQPTTG